MSEWERIREANRVRQEREELARQAADVELQSNATPETLRHRDSAVIDLLFRRDNLTPEQHQAGEEIAAVWMKITAGLFAKVQRYQREPSGSTYADWQASLTMAYINRYVPWRDEAGKIAVKEHTLAELVFKVVIDNYGMTQIAREWHLHPNRVKALTRDGLQRYARIAGWVDHCGRSLNAA